MAIVLVFAAVLLLWWRPFVAAACAVAFAILDLQFDDVLAANVSWTLVAGLHVAHVVVLRREQAQQRALAERVSVALPFWKPPAAVLPVRGGDAWLWYVGAAALAALAVTCAGMLVRAEASDRDHLARSHVVQGTVTEVSDDDLVIGVRLDPHQERPAEQIDLEPLDVYDVGDRVLVRVDPGDLGWSHLVAEPPDRTWWASFAVAAALLSILLAERPLTARLRRGVLRAHPPARGLPVRAAVDEDGVAAVACVDRDAVFASFAVEEVRRLEGHGEAPLSATFAPAHLAGDIRSGGWCALVMPDVTHLPAGPLVPEPDLPTFQEVDAWDEDDDDPLAGTSPVPADATPAELPLQRRPSVLMRGLGMVAAPAATAFGWWLLEPADIDLLEALFFVVTCLGIVHWAVGLAANSVTIDSRGILLSSALQRRWVLMAQIEEVRCSADLVVVVTRDEDAIELGPFEDGPAGAPEPSAREVAAAIDHARVAAGAVQDPGAPHSGWRRLAPGVPFIAALGAVLLYRFVSAYLL